MLLQSMLLQDMLLQDMDLYNERIAAQVTMEKW